MNDEAHTPAAWSARVEQGITAMGLRLDAGQHALLLGYLQLLAKWNRVYNLTAVRNPADMIGRHLLDSLTLLPWVTRGPVLDVGTGAGLPGIPLAVARPDLGFALLDANGKKTRFVQQAAAELGLANVEVIKSRVETFDRRGRYAVVTSRAFATLADMVAGSGHLLAADGCWLAMKGARPDAEISDLPDGLTVRVEPLNVPEEPGARHLAIIRRG